ncbi:MAG: hypothetical protein ABSC64_18685 [Candidatus Korobacteraceae bacterium]|jgi:hypothetical protein
MPTASHINCLAYRALLAAYPSGLRRRFGAEMVQVFADQVSEEWKQYGVLGVARVWLTATWEVVSVAVPLRLSHPSVIAAALSFIVSSALFLGLFRAISR